MKSQFDICILHCLEATVTGGLQTGGFSKGGIVTLKKAPSILFGSGAFLLNKNPKRIKKRVLFWRFRSPIQKPTDCKWGGNWNGEAVASQHCEISYFILGSRIECTLNICISGTSLVQLLRCNLNFKKHLRGKSAWCLHCTCFPTGYYFCRHYPMG